MAANISGTLPSFRNELQTLILQDAPRISGTIANSELPALEIWSVNNIPISGSLPSDLFLTSPNLQFFWMGQCKLSGSVPPFANTPKLRSVVLIFNHLTGTITVNGMESVETLGLTGNKLTGTLPSLEHVRSQISLFADQNKWDPKLYTPKCV